MKALFHIIALVGFFALLCQVTPHLPGRGETDAPLHRQISAGGGDVPGSYYLRYSYDDARTENVVTVVLADYRGFDTLGETIVVFAAGAACLLILGRRKES